MLVCLLCLLSITFNSCDTLVYDTYPSYDVYYYHNYGYPYYNYRYYRITPPPIHYHPKPHPGHNHKPHPGHNHNHKPNHGHRPGNDKPNHGHRR